MVIPADDVEVLHRKRRFRLVKFKYNVDRKETVYIEHWCRKRKARLNRKYHLNDWHGHTYHPGNRGMECPRCGERPADEIQALFWFLADEHPF